MFSKAIAKFEGQYKVNILGKKNKVYLYIYENSISGSGTFYYNEKFTEKEFDVEFQNMKEIGESCIQGNRCLFINYQNMNSLMKDAENTIYFPNIENIDEAITILCDMQKRDLECRNIKYQQEQARKEEQLIEKQKRKEESQQYFNNCYNFHIENEKNPYFELQNEDLQFTGIYIDKNKNLNFLKIDGYYK